MRLLCCGAILVAAATLPMTLRVAQAADGDTDVSVFAGETTGLTPILLVGGSGNYSVSTARFEGQGGQCETESTDGVVEVGICSVALTGTYVNLVCGTGSIPSGSTATVTEFDGATDTFTIAVQLVAGLGVVTFAGGAGVIQIEPSIDQPVGTPPVCLNGFSVEGVLVTG
jgi:hypothetical protein